MIEPALRYQTEGDDWIKRVLIGGALVFLSFFLVPIFTVYGYLLEVMRQVMRGDVAEPPAWGDYDIVQLSINGAKAFAILFAYGLVVGFVALLPGGVIFLLGAVLQSGIITALGTLIVTLLSLLGVIITAVVTPIMVCNFVLKGDLSAGFDIEVLRTFITNRTMLRALGIAIVVSFLVNIVSNIVFFTIIGPAIIGFFGLSAVAYIWATGFADAYREVNGELPAIPDGPTKIGVDAGASATAGAGATATGAGSTTGSDDTTATGGTPDDIATSGGESDDTDDSSSGPDPRDSERWD